MFPELLNPDGFPKWKTKASEMRLVAYNGTPIKCYGSISIPCNYNKSDWHNSSFYIVDVQGPAVLGLPSLEQLKLVTLHSTVNKQNTQQTPARTQIHTVNDLILMYPDRFDKIGSMPGSVKLSVNKNVQTHIDAPRKTPIELKDTIKQELNNMVENHIIRKVTEPIDWVSNLAYSHKKDGSKNLP